MWGQRSRFASPQEKETLMTNFVTGLIGFFLVLAFVGFMLWWVPAWPLIIIVAVVMFLLLIDFLQSLRNSGARP
jgi:hypothetical protein